MQRLRIAYYSVLIFFTALAIAGIANAQSALAQTTIASGKNLDVLVDLDACVVPFDFCTDTGLAGVAAADGNNYVVGIHVFVTRDNGQPVTGLPEANFSLIGVTNPAPGVTPAFVSTVVCASCFVEPQPGVYRLAARPSSGNWGDGSYVVLLQVTGVGGAVRQAIVPIDIPN